MAGYELLFLLSRFAFYYTAVLCTISWVYLERAQSHQIDEVLQSIDKKKFSYQYYGFLAQCLLNAIFLLLVFIVLITGSRLNDATPYFLGNMVYPYFCNIVAPFFIMLGLTYILSKGCSRIKSLCIYIAFLVLVSPFAENLIWQQKPAVPIDQIINAIRWPFTIFYQNGSWSADIQYGLQTEIVRVAVLGFWICLLVCCNYLINWLKSGRKKRIICGASLAGAMFLLIYSFLPASVYRLNERWDGFSWDMSVYSIFQGKNEMNKELLEDPGYRVSDYDMNLKFNRKMDVEGSMKVESDQPRSEFVFTLYRGFAMNRFDVSDISSQFRREGDLLVLSFAEPVSSFEAAFSYS